MTTCNYNPLSTYSSKCHTFYVFSRCLIRKWNKLYRNMERWPFRSFWTYFYNIPAKCHWNVKAWGHIKPPQSFYRLPYHNRWETSFQSIRKMNRQIFHWSKLGNFFERYDLKWVLNVQLFKCSCTHNYSE